MNNAYMIRNDGKEFPVTVHLYGSSEDVEETLYAAEWLYNHTANEYTKTAIVRLIASYAVFLDPDVTSAGIVPTLNYQFKHAGYKVISPEFLTSISSRLENINLSDIQSVSSLNEKVNEMLNQEFLRARYGGMYDSDNPEGKEMYFRISSIGFNWFNIIWNFVYDHKREISTVTIVKDPESTGHEGYYYKTNEGIVKHMPTEEFITSSGNPVFDSIYHPTKNMNTDRRKQLLAKAHVKDLANYEFSEGDFPKRK